MKQLVRDPVNLVVSGVGGQGNVMVSLVVGNALVNDGYFVTIGETYGSSQRGGSVMSHVKISAVKQYSPLISEGQADIILGMEPGETLRMLKQFGNSRVVTIVNPRQIHAIDITGGEGYTGTEKLLEMIEGLSAKTYVVNATEEAQKMGNPILANMILIGALAKTGLLPIEEKSLDAVIRQMFPKAVDVNRKALEVGMGLVGKR
ncbi:MAG: indolepyruvate oxidoreductase subunit beta [Dehalococcoidia bacterium]|nr:indolepyruvate oxidoreductase subunit beta [Dehalococcoidia bacterium]MDD5495287.1 indolepyruvate oxidoreductase subunit beta [Dehalococcoidia bacterium]